MFRHSIGFIFPQFAPLGRRVPLPILNQVTPVPLRGNTVLLDPHGIGERRIIQFMRLNLDEGNAAHH